MCQSWDRWAQWRCEVALMLSIKCKNKCSSSSPRCLWSHQYLPSPVWVGWECRPACKFLSGASRSRFLQGSQTSSPPPWQPSPWSSGCTQHFHYGDMQTIHKVQCKFCNKGKLLLLLCEDATAYSPVHACKVAFTAGLLSTGSFGSFELDWTQSKAAGAVIQHFWRATQPFVSINNKENQCKILVSC